VVSIQESAVKSKAEKDRASVGKEDKQKDHIQGKELQERG